jgi:hypothetical protein
VAGGSGSVVVPTIDRRAASPSAFVIAICRSGSGDVGPARGRGVDAAGGGCTGEVVDFNAHHRGTARAGAGDVEHAPGQHAQRGASQHFRQRWYGDIGDAISQRVRYSWGCKNHPFAPCRGPVVVAGGDAADPAVVALFVAQDGRGHSVECRSDERGVALATLCPGGVGLAA